MAKVVKDWRGSVARGMTGSVAGMLTFYPKGKDTVAQMKKTHDASNTAAQAAQRELFKNVAQWARGRPGRFNDNMKAYFNSIFKNATFGVGIFV